MKKQQGVALIEVAISIFILAVGLLGLASLQLISLKNMGMAQSATLANVHLEQIAEALRTNQQEGAQFITSGVIASKTEGGCELNCTPKDSAKAALIRIKNAIYDNFASPNLTITQEEITSYNQVTFESGVDELGALNTSTTAVGVFAYNISLSWVEQGDFLLKKDANVTNSQTLRVVLRGVKS